MDLTQSVPNHFRLESLSVLFHKMMETETLHPRYPRLFDLHPELNDQHRSNLIEWLSLACNEIDMSKRKFHLTVDYMDRYLAKSRDEVCASDYELVCQSALRLAMQDDTYMFQDEPPKFLPPFPSSPQWRSDDIASTEDAIRKHLGYLLEPVTTDMWLAYMLQYCKILGHQNNETNVFTTSRSQILFIVSSRACCACLLDVCSLKYPYRKIAASALWLFTKSQRILEASDLTWPELFPCVYWMVPFCQALKETQGRVGLKNPWSSHLFWEMDNFPYSELDLMKHAIGLDAAFQRDDVVHPHSKDVAQLFERIQAIDEDGLLSSYLQGKGCES